LGRAEEALRAALGEALNGLLSMREKEGEALSADLEVRLLRIETGVAKMMRLGPAVVEEYRTRLRERIKELTQGVGVDEQRLAQEVALFAERTDVAEEMTRLKSHLEQFRALLS